MTRKATKNPPPEEWLTAYYGERKGEGRDLYFNSPRRCDSHMLYGAFCVKGYDEHGKATRPSLVEELEARGYDVKTLEFRVRRARPAGPT